ncbi:MAG: glucosaminidase domain-containing protein [Sphingobacteriaceae bacterium]
MKKSFFLCFLLVVHLAGFGQTAGSNYVERYKDLAIAQMEQTGVPASVILAVAMHESASGTSKIARRLNNHFGIKGKNRVKSVRSAYKSYDSVEDSYADFIATLKKFPSFAKLFTQYGPSDYKQWVRGIQRGGYAHSKTWGAQVLGFINKYDLHQFDKQTPQLIPEMLLDTVAEVEPPIATPATPVHHRYTVKKGDTLSGIAKRLGTSVSAIMKKNKLKTSRLHPGQKLSY